MCVCVSFFLGYAIFQSHSFNSDAFRSDAREGSVSTTSAAVLCPQYLSLSCCLNSRVRKVPVLSLRGWGEEEGKGEEEGVEREEPRRRGGERVEGGGRGREELQLQRTKL